MSLVRGLVMASIIVAAARLTPLRSGEAAFRNLGDDDDGILLWGLDGRLTFEGQVSVLEESVLTGGFLSADAQVEPVEFDRLAGSGYELSATAEVASGEMMIVEDALIPAAYGGVIEFEGDLVLGPESILLIEIGGDGAVEGADRVMVLGEAHLRGSLIIEFAGGREPWPGEEFIILTADAIVGQFDSVEWPSETDGISLRVDVRVTEVVIVAE